MAVPTAGLSICSGIGGFDLALGLAVPGYRTICHVEGEAYAAAVLAERMDEGSLAQAPIWSDVRTFDGRPWRGLVDIVTAGFPCQPWSQAGKRRGSDDERWLWPYIARVVREIRPGLVFLENVPGLIVRGGLAAVLGDLAELGFDAEWGVFRASDVGAPHGRARVLVLAYSRSEGRRMLGEIDDTGRDYASGNDADGRGEGLVDVPHEGRACAKPHANGPVRCVESGDAGRALALFPPGRESDYAGIDVAYQPAMERVADGTADWVDEVRASGGSLVPLVAAFAFVSLARRATRREG